MSTAPAKSRSEELAPLRPVRLGPASVEVERKPDGTILLRSPRALEPYPETLTERLAHWAEAAPERIFLAQRDRTGAWRSVTYRQAFASVRAIAAALLERELSPERPIAILSGNDIEHALLGLAAMHVGRALRADLGALFAGLARLQEAEGDHRDFDAGSRLRRRRERHSRPPSRRPCRRTSKWRSPPIRPATGR